MNATEELRRYSRHVTLPEVGLEGQKKIRGSSVLCIGAGGLGSPVALYLAAAGIESATIPAPTFPSPTTRPQPGVWARGRACRRSSGCARRHRRCADVAALRAAVPPPTDRAVRAKVDALGVRLAALKALLGTGQWSAARAQAAPLVADARKVAYQPLLAEALL